MSNSFRFDPDDMEYGYQTSRKSQKAAERQRRIEARKRELPQEDTEQLSDDEVRRNMSH